MKFSSDVKNLLVHYDEWLSSENDIEKAKELIDNLDVSRNIKNYKKRLEEIFLDDDFVELSKIDEKDYFLVFWLYNYIISSNKEQREEKKELKKDELEKEEIVNQNWYVEQLVSLLNIDDNKSLNKKEELYRKLNRYGIELLYKKIFIGGHVRMNWIEKRAKPIKIDILKDCLYGLFFYDEKFIINKIIWTSTTLRWKTLQILEEYDFDLYKKFKKLIIVEFTPWWYTKIRQEKTYYKYLYYSMKSYKNENSTEDPEEYFKKFAKNAEGIMWTAF